MLTRHNNETVQTARRFILVVRIHDIEIFFYDFTLRPFHNCKYPDKSLKIQTRFLCKIV